MLGLAKDNNRYNNITLKPTRNSCPTIFNVSYIGTFYSVYEIRLVKFSSVPFRILISRKTNLFHATDVIGHGMYGQTQEFVLIWQTIDLHSGRKHKMIFYCHRMKSEI